MADGVQTNTNDSEGAIFVTAELTWSGESMHLQGTFPGILSGSEGSWSFAQIVGGAGAVAAGVQRVRLASDDPAVTDLAALEVLVTAGNAILTTMGADTGGMLTALQLIDDAVYTDGVGTPSKGILVMGHDGTNPQALSCSAAGALSVLAICSDGGSSLSVDQSGTWNIGTVTTVTAVTSITNTVAVTGTFWQATQPVSGTVTANAGTNLNTSALALEAGGNLAAAATSLAVVDDWDSSDDCRSVQQGAAIMDGATRATIKRASGIATDSGANTLIAAMADYQIRVLALSLIATSTTAVSAYIYNGDKMLLGDGTNKITLDMDGVGGPAGLVMPWNPGGWFQTDTDNEALAINLSGATPVVWALTYIEVT